jgi:hypothetical protein
MEIEKFKSDVIPGDVFQITACSFNDNWDGCLVLAREVKRWGIVGEINYLGHSDETASAVQLSIPLRLNWDEIEYVGTAPLIPMD